MRRRAFAAAAAAAAALAVPAGAGSAIVIGKGIGGAVLGMTQAQVRAKLGKPKRTVRGKNEFGSYTEYRYPKYQVFFQGHTAVTGIVTTSLRERTPQGLGVGSTWTEVRARLRVRCEGPPARGHCYVGRFVPGARVTDFVFDKGLVGKVIVALVID